MNMFFNVLISFIFASFAAVYAVDEESTTQSEQVKKDITVSTKTVIDDKPENKTTTVVDSVSDTGEDSTINEEEEEEELQKFLKQLETMQQTDNEEEK